MKRKNYLALFVLILPFWLKSQEKLSVFFDFNADKLTSQQANSVTELKKKILSRSVTLVKLDALTDTVGSISYNNQLAQRRANSVLEMLGVRLGDVPVELTGEKYIVATNYYDSDHRRVDIWYDKIEEMTEEISSSEPSPLILKLTDFLKDSLVDEIMIELSIHFVPGKALLLPESNEELWNLFDFFHYNDNINGFIRGHVCCSDDMPLSIERASVVYKFLVDRSISPNRMKYQGYSNSIPAVTPEVTDEDRKRNRRVDVIFTKSK